MVFFSPRTSGINYCKLRRAIHFNRNISYIKFAVKQPPSFQKPQTRYWVWRHCPSSANSQTSKITSDAIQFKSTEPVSAVLRQRTSTSLKISKEMGFIEILVHAHPHLHLLPRFSKNRIHLLTVTWPQNCSVSSMNKIFETPLKIKGTLGA